MKLSTKIPAYNTQDKQYIRKLPPVRNQALINVSILCIVLNKIVPQNESKCLLDGLLINGQAIHISEGIATFGKTKARFSDLHNLLKSLVDEHILIASKLDLRVAKDRYYEKLNSKLDE